MQKTILALALASLATTAVAKSQDEDSVYSWGKWATLVKPAAGPQVPAPQISGLGVPGFGAGDTQQFTPMPIVPEEGGGNTDLPEGRCAAGVVCGYALIAFKEGFNAASSSQDATPSLMPIPEGSIGTTSLAINSNTNIPLAMNIVNSPVAYGTTTGDVLKWSSVIKSAFSLINASTADVGGAQAVFGRSLFSTPSAGGGMDVTSARFVSGETTGIDDLNALNAGDVQATYSGLTSLSGTAVEINVDFGEGTWAGSWNGGTDAVVNTSISSDGVTVLSGGVGFEASGIVNGANIVGTSVSAADAVAISGTVDGSFFGGDAGMLAGTVNIDKETNTYDGKYQDIYVTADPTKVTGVPGAP